jgi:hypothetical protein
LKLLSVGVLALLLSACTEDQLEKLTSSGGGSSDDTSTTAGSRSNNQFSLVFEQTYQPCRDCGMWFDSAELVIQTDKGTFRFNQIGSLQIRQNAKLKGYFRADITPIPGDAQIQKATLTMRLNRDEGLANEDFSSRVSVSGYINGSLQYARDLTASDIKARGYSKANPAVPFDFTQFARRL